MNQTRIVNFDSEKRWLEPLLRERIPLAGTMDLRIGRLDASGIRLDFPLAPSVNDKGTAFGGALASAMILAGWALPRLLLRRQSVSAELVIGRCELRFTAPVRGAYSASCDWPDQTAMADFIEQTRNAGKGRLDLTAAIYSGDQLAATLQARYAALVVTIAPTDTP